MTVVHILVFITYTVILRWLLPRHWRGWFVLVGSLLAIFWLQPSSPIRNLDYWLPTASLALVLFTWAIVRPVQDTGREKWLPSLIVAGGCLLVVGLLRYLPGLCCLGPARPPQLFQVLAALAIILLIFVMLYRFSPGKRWAPTSAILILLLIFVFLKSPALTTLASAGLRGVQGQPADFATFTDLPWLGFSYLAFRLIHVLRDYQTHKLPPVDLGEFSIYALFYPAFTAGPIDRLQRFSADLRKALAAGENPARFFKPDPEAAMDSLEGGKRILFGVFKKFVLADSLALISLNNLNATQTNSTGWMWVLLYAYAFRLYFDFAGYTDIAVGLGRLAGIRLPENFDRPYLKPNLTAFWNSWHMTLAQWFRAYFFNPLTRWLRTSYRNFPSWSIVLVGQMSTMILIGLWHGITWSYFAWGVWHGGGLFVHSRWVERRRAHSSAPQSRLAGNRLAGLAGTLLTFHFVLLGWVWFASPEPAAAVDVFHKLFGL